MPDAPEQPRDLEAMEARFDAAIARFGVWGSLPEKDQRALIARTRRAEAALGLTEAERAWSARIAEGYRQQLVKVRAALGRYAAAPGRDDGLGSLARCEAVAEIDAALAPEEARDG